MFFRESNDLFQKSYFFPWSQSNQTLISRNFFTSWLTNTPRFNVKMRVAFRSGSIPTVRNNGTRLPTMSAYRFRRCWSFVHIWPRMRSVSNIIESGTRRGRISRSLVISVRVVISWVLHFSHCWIYCFPEKKKIVAATLISRKKR